MSLLSNESDALSSSGFADGMEFEETFPEPAPAADVSSPSPDAPPQLTVIDGEPAVAYDDEPAVANDERQAATEDAAAPTPHDAAFDEQFERRLREAEAMVKDTIDRIRVQEEQRLAGWIAERRAAEERRIETWADERRTAIERTLAQQSVREDALVKRIEEMLSDWQARFEQRVEQRRAEKDRVAERRRQGDEQRLRAWRAELERTLATRFAEGGYLTSLPGAEALRDSVREAIARAASARDIGRVLRDALAELARTSALVVSVHHPERAEVAYRYRVASEDDLGNMLRQETLDDGPDSASAYVDGWLHAHRTLRVGGRNVVIHTAQCAIRADGATIGVLTLQTEGAPIAEPVLAHALDLVTIVATRLAELRAAGSYRGE